MRGLREKWTTARSDVYAITVLLILVWAPFIARLAMGRSALDTLISFDIGFQWAPFRSFIERSVLEGVFPLWTPQIYCGMPFAAFSHSGVFYPPGWLFFLGDYPLLVNFFYPLHILIAGTGAYAVCRRMGLGPLACLLAAGSYCFTGKVFYMVQFLPTASSNAWVPWFLFCALSFLGDRRLLWFTLVGFLFALMILGGDVESTSYALLFCALFLPIAARELGLGLRLAPLLVLSLAVGALIAGVQLFPLQEYSSHFVRNEGVTFEFFSGRTPPFAIVWAVLLPIKNFFAIGKIIFEGPYLYLGVVTLSLAVVAIVEKSRPSSRLLGGLSLFAIAWSMGGIPAIDRLQYMLPVLNRFGSPEHTFFMAQLFIVILAGQGFESLVASSRRRGPGVVLMVAVFVSLVRVLAGLIEATFLAGPWLLFSLTGLLFCCYLFFDRLRSRVGPHAIVGALLLFQLVEVYSLAWRYLPDHDPSSFEYQPWLRKIADATRPTASRHVIVTKYGISDTGLLYHSGLALDLDAIDGWISVPPRRYVEFMTLVYPRAVVFKEGKLERLSMFDLRHGKFYDSYSFPLLDLISLRYFIDRGLPLKFSSPLYVSMLPPEVFKRRLSEAADLDSLPGSMTAGDVVTASGDLIAPINASYQYRLFVGEGDRLELASPVARGRRGEGARCGYGVKLRDGATTVLLHYEEIDSVDEQGYRPGPVRRHPPIDLGAHAGREVELIVSTVGPEHRDDLSLKLFSPRLVNSSKTLQQLKLPAELSRDRSGELTDVMVYENREAFPRAFVVYQAETIADDEALLARLGSASRSELRSTAFVEREVSNYLDAPTSAVSNGRARLTSRVSGREFYEVESSRRGLLFISDQYYPGWRAYVGSREVPIYRADHAFRAVPVPAGTSLVRMVFAPLSFSVGLWASLASVLFWALAIVVALRKRGSTLEG